MSPLKWREKGPCRSIALSGGHGRASGSRMLDTSSLGRMHMPIPVILPCFVPRNLPSTHLQVSLLHRPVKTCQVRRLPLNLC